MKLTYHPPHMILVHFPAALLPMEFICAIIAIIRHDPTFNYAGFYALGGGVIAGWLAVIFGFADLIKIAPENKTARQTALIHGGINTVLLIGYSVLFFIQWDAPILTYTTIPVLLIKGVLLLLLVVGNYLGAQLVLKHKIGTITEPTPLQPKSHA